jgi:hypothetical protein
VIARRIRLGSSDAEGTHRFDRHRSGRRSSSHDGRCAGRLRGASARAHDPKDDRVGNDLFGRFYQPPPNVGLSENFEFFAGKRYAVIARRNHDGTFRFDGFCGFTTQIGLDKMRALMRLTRSLA